MKGDKDICKEGTLLLFHSEKLEWRLAGRQMRMLLGKGKEREISGHGLTACCSLW